MANGLMAAVSGGVLVAAGLEAVLAQRNLRWLAGRPGEGAALAAARTRLAAARLAGLAALCLAVQWRGAPSLLPGWILPWLAWLAVRLADLGVAAADTFLLQPQAGLARPCAVAFWRARLATLAAAAAGMLLPAMAAGQLVPWAGRLWWLAAWVVWVALLAWRECVPPAGRRLSSSADLPLAALLERVPRVRLAVADESRRSSQLNARAEGVGWRRRVVVNDTLLASAAADKVAAVVAHELGHLAARHRELFLAWRAAGALAALAAIQAAVAPAAALPALAWLLLAAPVVTLPLRPLENALIRRWEYQADAFAAGLVGAGTVAAALAVVFSANRVVTEPEPVYAAFHASHPSPAARLRRLSSQGAMRAGRPRSQGT